jgi:hypothetical protein
MHHPLCKNPAPAFPVRKRRPIEWLALAFAFVSATVSAYSDEGYPLGSTRTAAAAPIAPALAATTPAQTAQVAAPSVVGVSAGGSTPALIDLEKTPVLPPGPSIYLQAGPAKTITAPNLASLNGGTILGNATNFPAQSYATAPNVYATSSKSAVSGADPSLQSTLTIDIAAGYTANEVSFPLFNGMGIAETYTVNAYAGASVVATQTLQLASNSSSGFGVVDLVAPGITRVVITPGFTYQAGYWNYAIDTIALNQKVQNALKTLTTTTLSATPNPAALNQAVTASVIVAPTTGTGTPTGNVTIGDGTANCTAILANGRGTCSLSFATAGSHALTATYSGDTGFAPSAGGFTVTVNGVVTPPGSATTAAPTLSTWATLVMISVIVLAAQRRRRRRS